MDTNWLSWEKVAYSIETAENDSTSTRESNSSGFHQRCKLSRPTSSNYFRRIIFLLAAWHRSVSVVHSLSIPLSLYSDKLSRALSSTKLYQQSQNEITANGETSNTEKRLKVSFVTGNSMKVNEVQRILSEHAATRGDVPGESFVDLRVVTVDLPELQEVDTIAIAKDKVLLAAQLAGGPCLVEDTSLQFTALGGMPGPYIKWFQDRLQCHGLYNILAAYEDKSATAVCTLAFCPAPHADPVLFTGECHGTIVAPVEGRGFGWDSIFVPHTTKDHAASSDASDETNEIAAAAKPFSLMSTEEKNIYSHRGKAVRKWADWIGRNRDALWERQQGNTYLPGHKGLDFSVQFPEQ